MLGRISKGGEHNTKEEAKEVGGYPSWVFYKKPLLHENRLKGLIVAT